MSYEDIERKFSYRPPNLRDQDYIRSLHRQLAFELDDFLPEGREKALAITKLQESLQWSLVSVVTG